MPNDNQSFRRMAKRVSFVDGERTTVKRRKEKQKESETGEVLYMTAPLPRVARKATRKSYLDAMKPTVDDHWSETRHVRRSSSSSAPYDRRGEERRSRHPQTTLDYETSCTVGSLIREYARNQMPRKSDVLDTDYHCIKLDGEVVAEYCNVCQKFKKKGQSMHWTAEHLLRRQQRRADARREVERDTRREVERDTRRYEGRDTRREVEPAERGDIGPSDRMMETKDSDRNQAATSESKVWSGPPPHDDAVEDSADTISASEPLPSKSPQMEEVACISVNDDHDEQQEASPSYTKSDIIRIISWEPPPPVCSDDGVSKGVCVKVEDPTDINAPPGVSSDDRDKGDDVSDKEATCARSSALPPTVSTLNSKLLFSSKFSDINILCPDGKRFPAHKNILAAASPTFATLLEFDPDCSIAHLAYPSAVVEAALRTIYEAPISLDHSVFDDHLDSCLFFASAYQVEAFQRQIHHALLQRLAVSNLKKALQQAKNSRDTILREGCLDFVCQNHLEVLAHPSIACLSVEDPNLWKAIVEAPLRNASPARAAEPTKIRQPETRDGSKKRRVDMQVR